MPIPNNNNDNKLITMYAIILSEVLECAHALRSVRQTWCTAQVQNSFLTSHHNNQLHDYEING